MPRRDFLTSLVLIALGVFVTWQSFLMPSRDEAFYESPGFLPFLLGIFLGCCGVLLAIRSIRAGGWRLGLGTILAPGTWKAAGAVPLVVTLLLILLYAVVFVDWIPFPIATFIFVFAFIGFFEWEAQLKPALRARRLGTACLQAILVAGAVTFLFERVFLIYLPG